MSFNATSLPVRFKVGRAHRKLANCCTRSKSYGLVLCLRVATRRSTTARDIKSTLFQLRTEPFFVLVTQPTYIARKSKHDDASARVSEQRCSVKVRLVYRRRNRVGASASLSSWIASAPLKLGIAATSRCATFLALPPNPFSRPRFTRLWLLHHERYLPLSFEALRSTCDMPDVLYP